MENFTSDFEVKKEIVYLPDLEIKEEPGNLVEIKMEPEDPADICSTIMDVAFTKFIEDQPSTSRPPEQIKDELILPDIKIKQELPCEVTSSSSHSDVSQCDIVQAGLKVSDDNSSLHQANYLCEVCRVLFPSLVDRHIQPNDSVAHTKGNGNYKCLICGTGKSFLNSNAGKYSARTAQKPYKCLICLKTYSSVSDLKVHVLIHTGDNSFVCSVCSKSFQRARSLKLHSRNHIHKCLVCCKTFNSVRALKDHTRVHTGEKPFK